MTTDTGRSLDPDFSDAAPTELQLEHPALAAKPLPLCVFDRTRSVKHARRWPRPLQGFYRVRAVATHLDVTPLLTTEAVFAGFAINGDLLLYEIVTDGVFVIDGHSGDEVASYSIFLDGDLTIWVP